MASPKVYTLPYFGEIDLMDPDTNYDAEMEFQGRAVDLDITLDDDIFPIARLDAMKRLLERLPEQDQRNRQYMRADYDSFNDEDDSLKFYMNTHIDEIGEEQLTTLLGLIPDEEAPIEEQLLDKLVLVRIGFYPDDEACFAICDYSFGREITNYVIVVQLNEDGGLEYMTVES